MKASALLLCVMVLVIAVSASAGDKTLFGSTEKYDRAEATLLMGLASDNEGLRESAAYMLGELKSDKAVIPLMGILRCESCSTGRVVAALALCRIGDPRGVYAVKQAVQFDDEAVVQQRCAYFYNAYVQPGTFNFTSAQDTALNVDVAVR
jgi:hypothetical protein